MQSHSIVHSSGRLPQYGILVQSRLQRPGNTKPHSHRANSLMYVVAGRGECLIDSKAWPVGPDTAIVLAEGRQHQLLDAQGEPMAVFTVYFSEAVAHDNGDLATELFRAAGPLPAPRYCAQQIRRTLRRMLHEQDRRPPKYEFAVRQGLSLILLELYRAGCRQAESGSHLHGVESAGRVSEVLEHISARHYEQQSLAAAAKMSHLSQRQFANLCRRLTGQSFVSFINGVRCDRAKHLLMQTGMPVSAVAFEVGFEELSTFYRAFRKHCGASPMSFRELESRHIVRDSVGRRQRR